MKFKDFFIPSKNNNFNAYLLRLEATVLLTIIMFLSNTFLAGIGTQMVEGQVDLNSIVYLHNRERLKSGLSTLTLNSNLIESAKFKANLMLKYDCWDHYCPPGTSPWVAFDQAGYKYIVAGENLAEGFWDNEIMMRAWMNSPTHRDNVLKADFREIGISILPGYFQGKDDNNIVVVHFGTPLEERITHFEPASEQISNYPDLKNAVDSLKNIAISYPQKGQIFDSPQDLSVKGIFDPGIEKVELFLGPKSIGFAKVEANTFQFDLSKDTQTLLNQGTNKLHAIGYDRKGNVVDKSTEVVFSLDSISPILDLAEIKVDSIQQEENGTYTVTLSLPATKDTQTSHMFIADQKIPGMFVQNQILYDINYNILQNSSTAIFESVDQAGNIFVEEYDITRLYSDIDRLVKSSGANSWQNEVADKLSVIKFDLDFGMSSLGLSRQLNLLVVLLIISLIVVDYLVVRNYKEISIHRHGNHHIKLALLVVIAVMTVSSAGVGSILYGIQA